MRREIIKIKREDIKKGNPFWQFSRFKRVHKSKKRIIVRKNIRIMMNKVNEL